MPIGKQLAIVQQEDSEGETLRVRAGWNKPADQRRRKNLLWGWENLGTGSGEVGNLLARRSDSAL